MTQTIEHVRSSNVTNDNETTAKSRAEDSHFYIAMALHAHAVHGLHVNQRGSEGRYDSVKVSIGQDCTELFDVAVVT